MLRLLSLLFSALCATGLVAQQDLEARLDAVKEFARYFRKAKEEALQVDAVMTLKGKGCESLEVPVMSGIRSMGAREHGRL